MIDVRVITDEKTWQEFFLAYPTKSFLHDWLWCDVQKRLGRAVHRIGVFENGALVGIAAAHLFHSRTLGERYLHVPHGPLIDWGREDVFDALVAFLRTLAARERAQAIRMSPGVPNHKAMQELFHSRGFRTAPIFLQPEHEVILDVSRLLPEIIARMRRTTRYLVGQGEKYGITVRQSDTEEALREFLELYRATARRQHFAPYADAYLRAELDTFRAERRAAIFTAAVRDVPLYSALILFSHRGAFYHHAAMSDESQKIPAAYVAQREIIREAQRRGCAFYNLHGATASADPRHPLRGVSLFKLGFGGEMIEYLPSQYLMLSPRFLVTLGAEWLVRLRRGYRN